MIKTLSSHSTVTALFAVLVAYGALLPIDWQAAGGGTVFMLFCGIGLAAFALLLTITYPLRIKHPVYVLAILIAATVPLVLIMQAVASLAAPTLP